jgi:hypothetical protein
MPNSSAITVITISGSMPSAHRRGQELAAEPDHHQQRHQVEPVARGQQQRLAADLAVELAEGDQRARERDRADQDADVDLHLVDGLFRALQLDRGIDIAGKPTRQAARPTRLCMSATSSGIWVILTTLAAYRPMPPPITSAPTIQAMPPG